MKPKTGSDYARDFFSRKNSDEYDRLVRFATLGMDSIWKKEIIRYINPNSYVLDLACGTGILTNLILEEGNRAFGLDLTFSYLQVLQQKGIKISIINSTAQFIPLKSQLFDCIVTSYLPKYTDLNALIDECYRLLKTGGLVVFHDFTLPDNHFYQTAWNFYFKIIKLVWRKNKSWENVFNDLDHLIRNNRWDKRILQILEAYGFSQINIKYLTFETASIVTAVKR